MKLFVGLGNPGKKYDNTRHNVGFMVIDLIATQNKIEFRKEKKFIAEIGIGEVSGEKVILVKPLTFMNLSGESVRKIIDFYKIDVSDILIIFDDMDLPVGKIRLRQKGSAGGHNGIKSIIAHLGTQEFKRVKVGIGKPTNIDTRNYVLSKFSKEEKKVIDDIIIEASSVCHDFLGHDIISLMNKYN